MIQNLSLHAMAILFVSSLIILLISLDTCIEAFNVIPRSAFSFGSVLLVLGSLAPAQIDRKSVV